MNYINKCTIGADPELFIINTKTNKVVSSIGLIPGEKNHAYRSDDMPEGFGIEIDNILAEFNIPPVHTVKDFIDSINYMKNYIRQYVQKINPDLDILCTASQEVDESELSSPEAKLFGCDPDYNVYTEEQNPKPKGDRGNLRSAGFHIHVGYPNFNIRESLKMLKYIDAYVGVPSVLKDPDTKRRNLYGKAGSFRLQPWGFEYRVLSSYMMKDDETLTFVWEQLTKAINAYYLGAPLPNTKEVMTAINTSDIALASSLINIYNLV